MIRLVIGCMAMVSGLCASGSASAVANEVGHLPMGYRVAPAASPWTGRLHAIGFRTTADVNRRGVLHLWEAGDLLDQRATDTRRLYLGGSRLTPLRWPAIDAEAKHRLNIDPATSQPDTHGADRLSWLRGNQPAVLRPRDTRLASATGARVHVVSPPAWQPMQPGHTAFRNAHALRPTTVWLGTRDGILHGFHAITGQELTGYLPRAALGEAAALTAVGTRVSAPPCPRPHSVDADPNGRWRTLLLCATPATARTPGSVFALDVSTPGADTPIQLIWEVTANDALPLTGSGPLRAAMYTADSERRWFAVGILAPGTPPGARAGLALLPLDRPAGAWATTGRVPRLPLPEQGCDSKTATTQLLAVTVRSDASGAARAAYAIDDVGRLWRFPFDALGSNTPPQTATCLHRQSASTRGSVEPPLITYTGAAPLIVYGTGDAISAIPDRTGKPANPRPIHAIASGNGVVLRAAPSSDPPGTTGWTLALPHPGEQIETLHAASPAHLAFTTLAPDGRARSYLIDAATGESVTVLLADGKPGAAITGLPFDPAFGGPIVGLSPVIEGAAVAPGTSRRDVHSLALWQIDGDGAYLQQHAYVTRRRGRLGWRELIRTPL
ncbi:pilus assembly protein [Cupriavidus campinensis]|uniref:pilus assembly protein PilY n=1 Tax=Cupriavidus campinensis TaxID=151783 RepID=UPI0021CC7A8F|nr:pilus assembly protein PilY [Cupriavidus campinensis]